MRAPEQKRLSNWAKAAPFVAALLVATSQSASADALQTYFGIDQGSGSPPTAPVNSLAARNNFIAAFTSTGVENFDSLTLGAFPSSLSFPATAITAEISTTDSTNNYVSNGTTFGTFATSGTQYLYNTGAGSAGANYTLTFNSPVAGIGMYVTDLNDGTSPADQLELLLTLTGAGGQQSVQTSLGLVDNNADLIFFGVESADPTELISSVQILNTVTDQGDSFGIDDLTIGTAAVTATPVPEPFTLSLFGAGLAGAAALRRRKKAQKA